LICSSDLLVYSFGMGPTDSVASVIDTPKGALYIGAPRAGPIPRSHLNAQVAELVDALVSGISGEIRGGSSPLLGTTLK
jgi:hypothetical protein